MDSQFQRHLEHPVGVDHTPTEGFTGAAGGNACGDLVRLSLVIEGDRVADAGFAASGCGAVTAAGSACVALLRGHSVLEAGCIGPDTLERELGGLIGAKRHAVELVADAMHRALGAAVSASGKLAIEPNRTLVAMSGGVDSAVAALLCRQAGEQAVAVTLELWADADNDAAQSCCSAAAVRSARALAHELGMPHFTLDLREQFRAGVVEPFIEAHREGLTPNPCVRCNGFVRLDAMLEFADSLGAARLVTGHYARVVQDADGPLLAAARDPLKDQTYMLTALDEASLARMRFPLGDLHKSDVRELASEAGLEVARKPESQDLCFLAGTDRDSFLAKHAEIETKPGEIVLSDGRVVGTHGGTHRYTVGQRRGLGVAAREPLYVLATDSATDRVTVGSHAELEASGVVIRDVVLRRDSDRVDRVKLRYRSRSLTCRVTDEYERGTYERLELELSEPAYGVAPGQVASLMDGETLVGWGVIARRVKSDC